MNTKYNKYLKKKANYERNLAKRYGWTKKYQYIEVSSDGIEKSEKKDTMNGQYEFVLTRNKHGRIVTRLKHTYKWNPLARVLQKEYHKTKNGIKEKIKKPIELFWDKDHTKEEIKEYFKKKKEEKQKRLNDLPFSRLHYELVAGLYPNPTYTILKQEAEKAAHEEKIKQLSTIRKTKGIDKNVNVPLEIAA